MSVLLHMEPQDSPVVNDPATLFFSITDSEKAFENSLCDCHITIFDKDKKIFEERLIKNEPDFGLNVFSTEFSFPKKAVYRVIFDATPTTVGIFNPFSIEYYVRIERTSINQNPVNPVNPIEGHFLDAEVLIYLIGIFATVVILLIGFNINKMDKKK
jgi:hypothetical protein